MNQIYVIGHKNPDTDSVCSAAGYAALLNKNAVENTRYIPAACGKINPETKFALETFGVPEPEIIESIEPNVSDLKSAYTYSATEDVPTINIFEMMDEYNVRNIPIVDENGRLTGLMSERGLAQACVNQQKLDTLQLTPIKLSNLKKILNAEILAAAGDILEGRVYIAIDALHVTLSKITSADVAIVGDDEPSQLALISAGIAALIIANAAPVGERVIKAAQEKKVTLITTSLDAFGVGKMINLSLPVKTIMASDVPTVTKDDTIEYAKQLVADSRYRTACIIDKDRKLLGMISRNTFLDTISKQVILLDHNEFAQAVDGIENAEILEIIDHHRLGAITTLKPVRFQNEPVGSTSTIIAAKYFEIGDTPDRQTAGILLSGILSDTLVLRLSTTTEKDRKMVERLSKIAEVDPYEYGTELITKGMALEGCNIRDLLMNDTKKYDIFGRKVIISQIMIPTYDFSANNCAEIIKDIHELRIENDVDIFAVLLTSVFANGSELYIEADTEIKEACGMPENSKPRRIEGMMSRKNDFIPWFGNILKEAA